MAGITRENIDEQTKILKNTFPDINLTLKNLGIGNGTSPSYETAGTVQALANKLQYDLDTGEVSGDATTTTGEGNKLVITDENGNIPDANFSPTTTTHTQSTSIDELPTGAVDGNITDWSYDGDTYINIVSGEDVANGASVSFDSILNDIYYDTLNQTRITGTGSSISVTNSSGATADIMVFPISSLNKTGLSNNKFDDVASGGYFEGIKNVENPLITIKNSDETVDSQLQAKCELRSLQNGTVDSIEANNGEIIETKRVSDQFVFDGDESWVGFGSGYGASSDYSRMRIVSFSDDNNIEYNLREEGVPGGVISIIDNSLLINISISGSITNKTLYVGTTGDLYLYLLTTDVTDEAGFLAYLAANPITAVFQLATPVATNLVTEGKASRLLQSYEDGTCYLQSGYKKAHIAVSNDITLDSALSEITSIKELDETGDEINVLTTDDYDAFTAGDTTVTNLPSATATYLVEGLLMYNITGAFEGEIPTNTGARIDSAIEGTNANSKSISNLNDAVQLIIASL